MRDTLLRVVQDTMASCRDSSISTITENVLARDYVSVARSTFYEFVQELNIMDNNKIARLDAFGDLSRPNYLRIPDDVSDISNVYYTKTVNGQEIKYELDYLNPEDFLTKIYSKSKDDDDVIQVIDPDQGVLYIYENEDPCYFTSFNGKDIVCDSYNKEVDDTLKSAKTTCTCKRYKQFIETDDWVVDLPLDVFPAYKSKVKEYCHSDFKQQGSSIHRSTAHEQKNRARRNASPFDKLNKDHSQVGVRSGQSRVGFRRRR